MEITSRSSNHQHQEAPRYVKTAPSPTPASGSESNKVPGDAAGAGPQSRGPEMMEVGGGGEKTRITGQKPFSVFLDLVPGGPRRGLWLGLGLETARTPALGEG